MGIVEQSDNPRKPFTIIKSKDEIRELMETFYQGIPSKGHSETECNPDLHVSVNDRWRSQDNVNLESIIIICNWIDRLTMAKASNSAVL